MGEFFNRHLMNTNIPLNLFNRGGSKENLEALRKQFNKERDGQTLRSEAEKQEGIASSPFGDKEDTQPPVPPRRGRPRGTGRASKGNTR